MNIDKLRRVYSEFHYDAYLHYLDNDDIVIQFRFSCGEHTFSPTLRIKGIPEDSLYRMQSKNFDVFVFHLGMIEIFSYWKAFVSPVIVIHPERLAAEQLIFFNELLQKGMGEFFYVNQIDSRDKNFVTFKSVGLNQLQRFDHPLAHRYLVPVGGGKDSALTLGLLEKNNARFVNMLLNPQQAAKDVVSITKSPMILIERSIDSRLLNLHSLGHPNGHTPFSGYLAFLSVFAAAVFGYSTVLFSNERSAEEATVMYLDQEVNHQYTKTLAFESLFRSYLRQYVTPSVSYLSLLRPLYELQIAQKFSQYPAYHLMIRSCNRGRMQNRWCGLCSKCVSTYILLFPFLQDKTVIMFGKDLYQDTHLYERVQELIDRRFVRPFECVGTREESIIALAMAVDIYKQQGKELPALLKQIETTYLKSEEQLAERKQRLLSSFGTDHYVTDELISYIQ